TDSDQDGVGDACDNCTNTPNRWQADTDGDGHGDICDNCLFVKNRQQIDADHDGYGNYCDGDFNNDGKTDLDNDKLLFFDPAFNSSSGNSNYNPAVDLDSSGDIGINDFIRFNHLIALGAPGPSGLGISTDGDGYIDLYEFDNCPWDANTEQNDSDNDSVGDLCDNCPGVPNRGQGNFDGDAFGDVCDWDVDNDGIGVGVDNCHFAENPSQKDEDGDGIGDACDNCLFLSNRGQENLDGDAFGDACDWDTDGDDVGDADDAWPNNAAASLDIDQDGYPDQWSLFCDALCQTESGLMLDPWPFIEEDIYHSSQIEEWDGHGPITLQGRTDGQGVDLVILGDGFSLNEMTYFKEQVLRIANTIFTESTIAKHAAAWNIHAVGTVSEDSGINTTPDRNEVNTYYMSYFGCSNIDRLLCTNTTTALSVAYQNFPQSDNILMVANTTKYGGAGYWGQKIGTFSLHPSAIDIAKHELGHAFAGLGDEYQQSLPGRGLPTSEPTHANLTINSDPSTVKWNYWIDKTANPGGGYDPAKVHLFEGAMYQNKGVWRPTRTSLMRVNSQPFYAVNAEAWALNVYANTPPVLNIVPKNIQLIEHPSNTPPTFYLYSAFDSGIQQVEWSLNGEVIKVGPETRFTAPKGQLGSYVVSALIKDISGLIVPETRSLASNWGTDSNFNQSEIKTGTSEISWSLFAE
ncbi:MAG: M64 family metallopeptidase, partial [Myxococcota bacterium]|nr:M64 family metallopeptidase [Myxococcota bacterium]